MLQNVNILQKSGFLRCFFVRTVGLNFFAFEVLVMYDINNYQSQFRCRFTMPKICAITKKIGLV